MSHRTAPVALLEHLAMTGDEAGRAMVGLLRSDHISEVLVLATCNRVEVFAEARSPEEAVADISRLLALRARLAAEELSQCATVRHEEAAVHHLFSVAAGLDSMVVGEGQVIGQLRAAYALATERATVGCVLNPLVQRALRVGKRAHAETGIDRFGASVVSVALERAGARLGPLAGRSALVVGAGSMGSLAAATLARAGARVVVTSRTASSAGRLAERVAGRAADLARLPEELAAADLVVTCTGAAGLVLDIDVVDAAMTRRADRPVVIVDLALPRDVAPGVATLAGVHLVDLARLQAERAAPGGGAAPAGDLAAAQRVVDDEAQLWRAERQALAVAPTVAALRAHAAEVVAAELLRLSGRLPDLDTGTRAEFARTLDRVVGKLLHEPTVRLKQRASPSGDTDLAGALRVLFGLGTPADVDVRAA